MSPSWGLDYTTAKELEIGEMDWLLEEQELVNKEIEAGSKRKHK